MKMVDFDVAEVEYNMNKHKDIDIYSISYNKLVERLRRPQKYVLLEAFKEIYSLEIQDVTDTAVYLKLTDRDIEHYLKCEEQTIQSEKNRVIDIIDKKITQLAQEWYGAEDGSKEEKESNLQLNVLEEIRDKIKGEWRK